MCARAHSLCWPAECIVLLQYEFDSSQEDTLVIHHIHHCWGSGALMDISIVGATTRRLKISSWSLSIAFSCLGLAVFCLNLLVPYWFRLNQSGIGPYASDQDITRCISCPIRCGVEGGGERERERNWRATKVIPSLSHDKPARLASGGPMLSILLQRITNSHGDNSTPILLHS
jgi:hypothetical protein